MALQITTNNHERFFKYRHDVPEKILKEQFDYQDPETHDGFFKFKGHWYHLDQFCRFDNGRGGKSVMPFDFQGWDGYYPYGFSSGVLIKIGDDLETYKVATYLQKYGD